MMLMSHHKPLAPPGAGIPRLEILIGSMVVFQPMFNPERCARYFVREGRKILEMTSHLEADQLSRIVRVKRLMGIEDSSREWSVLMTVEHLLSVGIGVLQIVNTLDDGRTPDRVVHIEEVKPTGKHGPELITSFRRFLDRYEAEVARVHNTSPLSHPHDWFGALHTAEWLRLNALHQTIHRRQIQQIVRKL